MRGKFLCAFLLGVMSLPCLPAAETGSAGTESPFALGVSARALGLGKAYVAVADDAAATYWNPAGLAQLQQQEIGAFHCFLQEGTTYDFLGYVYPWYRVGTFALGGLLLRTADIEERDDHDYLLSTFAYQQAQGLLSYSRYLFPAFSAGVNIKAESQTIGSLSSTGLGLDLGFMYSWKQLLSVGLMLQNLLPPEFTLKQKVYSLPLNLKAGASLRYDVDADHHHRLGASCDVEKPSYAPLQLHAGLEYVLYHRFALRLGYDQGRPQGGAGVSYGGAQVDYALTWREPAGYMHMLSAGWRFGLSSAAAEKSQRERTIMKTLQELAQKMFTTYKQQGMNFVNAEQPGNAVEAFKKALGWRQDRELANDLVKLENASNRKTSRQYFEQANFKWAGQRELEAVEDIQEALRLNPADPEFGGRLKQMRKDLTDRALGAGALRGKSGFLKALDDFFQGDYAAALAGWKAVVQQTPDYPEAERYQETVQQILLRQQMLRPLKSREQEIRIRAAAEQAQGYYAAEKFTQAQKAWQDLLKTDPTHEEARMGLERVDLILKTLRERGIE